MAWTLPIVHFRSRIALAAFLLLASAAAADAEPRRIDITTYMRAGPGRQYTAIEEIAPGTEVDVQGCRDAWCEVLSRGAPGWIEAARLGDLDLHRPAPARPPGNDCFDARLNGRASGDTERFCTK